MPVVATRTHPEAPEPDGALDLVEAPPVRYLTLEEGRELFDANARELAGMPGAEFLARWDSGEYAEQDLDLTPEGRDILFLVGLMPFAR